MEQKASKRSYVLRLIIMPVMVMVLGLQLSAVQPAQADTPFTCPDGSTPQDINGDGVLDERDCVIEIVDPDLRGSVTVKRGCGFIKVTNHEAVNMRFRYGRVNHKLDHRVKVAPGATRKIKTSLRRIDWKATWSTKDPRVGHKRIRQNCASSTSVAPATLPSTGA